jgi:hypothetical protein
MQKAKAIRLAGFVGALGASAVLVGAAVQGTGAYFSDSHNGSISATTGHVSLAVSPANGELNFSGMLPGDYQSKDVAYTAHGTGAEDVWLVFPTNGDAEAFVGNPSDASGGGLGRYGHFALSSTNGAHFTSYNLNNPGTGSHSGDSCPTDANGEGGSNAQPATPTDTQVAFCAPPNAILLASGLANGQGGTATFTFGFTPLLRNTSQEDSLQASVAYKIVATQAGIRPDNPFNG